MSLVDKICYYQRNLEKYVDDEERILHCISKLHNLPVMVKHLQKTGVGRTVNSFRKYDGTVGNAARALVFKWKTMVAEESSDGEDEDEPCVPDVHKNYPDSQASPKAVDIQENTLSVLDQTLESKHTHKENKSRHRESDTMCSSKSKSEDKHEPYDKSKHFSKHHSYSEKKSLNSEKELKSSKSHPKREETHSSTKQSHNKTSRDNEDDSKKRKRDTMNVSKESKKRKLSDNSTKSDEEKLFNGQKNISCSKSCESNDQSDGQKKQEKSKSSSNKLKPDESNNKAKDSSEKQKYKKDEDKNHKKHDAKRDSSHHSKRESSKSDSSSDKTHSKNKEKTKKSEHTEKKSKHIKQKNSKVKLMQEINSDDGIDCNSGTSFAEALGMCTMSQSSKKRANASFIQSTSKLIKTEQLSPPVNNKKIAVVKTDTECSDTSNPSLLAPNVKLEPLSADLVTYTLPEISPNYRPLPHVNSVSRKEELKPVDNIIYVKNQRTKVYSGNKPTARYGTKVPTLYELCLRVLMDNIDALEYTGGVPYDILKPVLERASADQLFVLEHYNPYLIEDTGALWEYHCNKEFRSMERKEMESWRDMYMRCLDEREAKLKNVTANIKQSIDNSVPVRSTKLAYVDNVVKPPRNVLKKQAKYGTASTTPVTISSVKKKLASPASTNIATNIAVPAPPMIRFKALTSNNGKKTKAPLMAKALQLIKGRYKR